MFHQHTNRNNQNINQNDNQNVNRNNQNKNIVVVKIPRYKLVSSMEHICVSDFLNISYLEFYVELEDYCFSGVYKVPN